MSLAELGFPNPQPFVEIIEQPCKSLRFRYKVEGRPGLILGLSSTSDNKVPFSIRISGYTGRVHIVVSCVSKDEPYKPHPNNLVGQHCKNGYYYHETKISPENPVVNFPKMALQCVKRNEVPKALQIRETDQVDPFITGFAHKNDVRSINLNVVRLAIQVFLVNENRRHSRILNPIVTNEIVNKKLNPDPKIYRLSHCTSPADGGQDDIILLCTKITKEDIGIKFYQLEDDEVIWEDYGTFHSKDVYNNTSICFKPPPYKNLNILEPVDVLMQLVRPSDDAESSSHKFQYLPLRTVSKKRINPLFDQLVKSTKSQKLQNEIFRPLNVPITKRNDNLLPGGASWIVLDTKQENLTQNEIFQSLNIPVTKSNDNLLSGGASWMSLDKKHNVLPENEILQSLNIPVTVPNDTNLLSDGASWMVSATKQEDLPAWMAPQTSDNLPNFVQSWAGPPTSEIPKKKSLPDLNQPWMVPATKKNSLPNWMGLQGSEDRIQLPAFAQLLPSGDPTHQASRSTQVPRLDTGRLLMDSTPWVQSVPLPINNINETESESRGEPQGDTYPWNIQEDFVGSDVNIDSASGISRILDIDCNQIHLEPFNINSGDLEMTDVTQLSGSMQDHLTLID